MVSIPAKLSGWWRIVDTGTWGSDDIDGEGPALLSLTGRDDRLRMFVLLAYVDVKPTKTGASFTWGSPRGLVDVPPRIAHAKRPEKKLFEGEWPRR